MEDTTTIALLALYGGLLVLDLVAPARALPRVPHWRIKGLVAFVVYVAIATAAPMAWDGFLARYQLLDLRGLGTGWGTLVGVLALELGQYVWHRVMHATPFLWRTLHQMHHSAERLDVFGAFWFHPLDALGFTLVGSLALVLGVGLTPDATALAVAFMTFLAVFQHANLKTPRWLGYLVHRPEQHGLHHQRGLHGMNYGSLAIFDQLFGTFRNPATWDAPVGFYDGASSRIGEMLIGRDVTEPPPVVPDRPSHAPRWA